MISLVAGRRRTLPDRPRGDLALLQTRTLLPRLYHVATQASETNLVKITVRPIGGHVMRHFVNRVGIG